MGVYKRQPRLSLLPRPDLAEELVWFCAWCGRRDESPVTRRGPAPPCSRCLRGTLRVADADVAPRADAPFLLADVMSRITAISDRAMSLLNLQVDTAIGQPVSQLLRDPEAEEGGDHLRATVAAIAGGRAEAHRMIVRPIDTFGVHLAARMGVCWAPREALLVLEKR